MEFNKRKFNILVCFMIFIISAVVVFSTVELTSTTEKPLPGTSAEDQSQSQTPTDSIVVDEIKSGSAYLSKAPNFSNGFSALSYAKKIMKNFSFISEYYQIAHSEKMGVVVDQEVRTTRYKTNKNCLVLSKANCASSYGMTYTREILYEASSNIVKLNQNGDSNSTFCNEQTLTSFKETYGYSPLELSYNISSSTARMDSFVIVGKNYVLKLSMVPSDSNPDIFKNNEKNINSASKNVSNARCVSATFEITINRETGAFVKILTDEVYYCTKDLGGVLGKQEGQVFSHTEENFKFADINIDSMIS